MTPLEASVDVGNAYLQDGVLEPLLTRYQVCVDFDFVGEQGGSLFPLMTPLDVCTHDTDDLFEVGVRAGLPFPVKVEDTKKSAEKNWLKNTPHF